MDNNFREKFPSFPNYTEAMYEGKEPTTKVNSLFDWKTKFGQAQTTVEKDLQHCNVAIGHNTRIYIVGSNIRVVQFMSGEANSRVYSNEPYKLGFWEDKLEKQRALDLISYCKYTCTIWDIIKDRALQLIGGDTN